MNLSVQAKGFKARTNMLSGTVNIRSVRRIRRNGRNGHELRQLINQLREESVKTLAKFIGIHKVRVSLLQVSARMNPFLAGKNVPIALSIYYP